MAGGGWKLARNRSSVTAQLPLILCTVLAFVIVLLGKAEASIFDTARAKFSDWSAPALTALQGPVVAVQRWASGVSTFFSVYEENLQLREENEALRRWQDVALALEQRMSRYELLLNAVPDPVLPSITAQVIGQSSRPFVQTMIVNAGIAQNVKKGQAVLDDRGLIGRVYVTGDATSWIIRLTDLNSRVPVVIRPSNRRGILVGNNSMAPDLHLDSGEAPVEPGDRVYSTADGGLVPPDLPVGILMGDADNLRVRLFADPDLSDYVQIVDYVAAINPPPDDEGVPIGVPPAPPGNMSAPGVDSSAAAIADGARPQ